MTTSETPKFSFSRVRVTGEEADYYLSRYEVTVNGEAIGTVAQCVSKDWTWDGIDHYTQITTATRQMAAEQLLATITKK